MVGLKDAHPWADSVIAAGQGLVPGLAINGTLTTAGEAVQIALKVIGPVLPWANSPRPTESSSAIKTAQREGRPPSLAADHDPHHSELAKPIAV